MQSAKSEVQTAVSFDSAPPEDLRLRLPLPTTCSFFTDVFQASTTTAAAAAIAASSDLASFLIWFELRQRPFSTHHVCSLLPSSGTAHDKPSGHVAMPLWLALMIAILHQARTFFPPPVPSRSCAVTSFVARRSRLSHARPTSPVAAAFTAASTSYTRSSADVKVPALSAMELP